MDGVGVDQGRIGVNRVGCSLGMLGHGGRSSRKSRIELGYGTEDADGDYTNNFQWKIETVTFYFIKFSCYLSLNVVIDGTLG